MAHGFYNTSHRYRNRSHPRRHHDPQPRTQPRPRMNRLRTPASPSPPPRSPPQSLPPSPSLLPLRRRLETLQILRRVLRCGHCDGPLGIVYENLTQQPPCPCSCHQINISRYIPRDDFETTTTTTASDDGDDDDGDDDDDDDDDDDNDDRVILREIIREYLIPRDYSVIKSGNEEEEEEGGGEICVVCFNEMEEKEIFKRLDCGHDYHEECITKWLLRKNSCPICVSVVIPPNFYTTQSND